MTATNSMTATPMAGIAALTCLVCLGGATAAGCGEQKTCYVNPDQQQIECPGQEPYDLKCFAKLPDLNGDGLMTTADCALSGSAAAMREICWQGADPPLYPFTAAYLLIESCRGFDEQVLDTAENGDGSFASVASTTERLVVAYQRRRQDNKELVLLRDENDDGRLDDDTANPFWISSTTDDRPQIIRLWYSAANGQGDLMVLFVADGELRLWRDADGDGTVSAGEFQLLGSGVDAERSPVTVSSSSDVFTVGYGSAGSSHIWWDVNGDRVVDAGETETYSGSFRGHAVVGYDEHLWLATGGSPSTYQLATGRSSDGDAVVDATELSPSETWCPGWLVGSRYGRLVCVDPDSGATRIGTRVISSALEYIGGYGEYMFADGVWFDVNQDGLIDDGERLAVTEPDSASAVRLAHGYSLATVVYAGSDDSGMPELRLRNYVEAATVRYLGEQCGSEQVCATGLQCRVSGNNLLPRCVPPEAEQP